MIICVDGDNGFGKTVLLAMLSEKIKRAIWSNFTLFKHPQYKPLEIDDIIHLDEYFEPLKETGLVIFLDEAYTWLEARLSQDSTNLLLSYKTNYQWRKRGLDIYLTFQDFMSIDVRFRMRFHIFIQCGYREYDSEDPFVYTYYRVKKRTAKRKLLYTRTYSYEYMKQFFNLYDTYEIVEPLNKERQVYNIAKKNPDLMKKQLNRYYDILLPQVKKLFNGDLTKDKTELLLIRNKILPEYNKNHKLYTMLKNKIRL